MAEPAPEVAGLAAGDRLGELEGLGAALEHVAGIASSGSTRSRAPLAAASRIIASDLRRFAGLSPMRGSIWMQAIPRGNSTAVIRIV